MKELTIVFLSLVGWSSAYLIKVPTSNTPSNMQNAKIAPLGWVHIQKLLLPLFDNVCEESTNAMVVQLAKDFTLDVANGGYLKTDVIDNLRKLKSDKGFLPKGEIFSEYNIEHVKELKGLYEVFFYARDFDTFYRAAAWARQNVNCGLFVDAIYLAILNRKDTSKVSVPAPYELLPNYFIKKDAVIRASVLLNADDVLPTPENDVRVEGNSYVLDTKYTTELDDGDENGKLAYFREDIGLNAYYFLRKLRNVPWLNITNSTKNLYGERMFMMMRQFAARYDLERYSHGLNELEGFDWESTMPYDPMLIYSNGNEFDHRTISNVLSDNDDIAFLKTIENNIAGIVTHLRQAGHDKSQILSHLIDILVTSDKSYETVSRKLLGYNNDMTERHYSVVEHYLTSLRDPMFWSVNKKMVQLINNAIKILPSYSRNELYFPGVEVVNVETKKMMTSFDKFQFDVTDSLKSSTVNTSFQVKIAQPRLSHKPFIMKMNISSLVYTKGLAKIFIGPKMMPGELAMKKHLFVLLDSFEINLKRGFNVISRSSEEMTSFSTDFISLRALRKKVEDAEFGLDALPLKNIESQTGYPSRLILPRGLPNGLPLQVFVFVAPLTKGTLGGSTSMQVNSAILSPGYPLDLPIEIKQLFGLPNSLIREFVVTHKTEDTNSGNGGRPVGGGRPAGGGRPTGDRPESNNYNVDQGYDNPQSNFDLNVNQVDNVMKDDLYDDTLLVHGLLGDRPEFTYRKTDTTNYSGNKNQYRNKEDYSSKRTDKSFYTPKTDYNLPTQNDYSTANPVTETSGNYVNTLTVHGLLGKKPDFMYKNKDTPLDTKSQYDRNYENVVSEKTDETYNTTTRDKYIYDISPFVHDIVDEEIVYHDSLIPHGLLSDNIGTNIMKEDQDLLGKKNQYVKKEADRAAERERKIEKYIAEGEQKKEKSIVKGEKKKDEAIAKKEHKIEEHLAKKEKHLKDLIKKGTDKKITNEKVTDLTKEKSDESVEDFYSPTPVVPVDDINGEVQTISIENNFDHVDIHPDSQIEHNLLSSKVGIDKKDFTEYKTKTYKYKKTKEDFSPDKIQYNKKMDYREGVLVTDSEKTENAKVIDINEKYAPEYTNDKNTYTYLDQNKIKLDSDLKLNYLQQNNFDDHDEKTNKEVTTTTYTTPKYTDDRNSINKDVSKTFEGKQVNKNIVDEKVSKNVVVNKGTVTKKDVTKKIPQVKPDKTVDLSTSEENSKELSSFTVYEPVITTDSPKGKKRFSVYDFLFNPPIYDDDEDLLYE